MKKWIFAFACIAFPLDSAYNNIKEAKIYGKTFPPGTMLK
jgi:hypothetical protein